MSRKPRIEFAGAIYHVISRGNYRKDLFTVGDSGVSFEKALLEVCERTGWKLHAEWKQSIAVELRRNCPASNPWIAGRLNMGHPSNISWALRHARKS